MLGHQISTAFEMGWSNLSNGDLLDAAENIFDLFITTDKNLHHQQALSGRRLAIIVLPTTSWPEIREHTEQIANEVEAIELGEFREVAW